MTDLDKLEELAKADVSDDAHTMLPGTTVLALVAECRELRRLRGAFEFIRQNADVAGSVGVYYAKKPERFIEYAKQLGWKEGT